MLNHRHKTQDYRNPFKKLNCKDILISCRPLNDTLTTRGQEIVGEAAQSFQRVVIDEKGPFKVIPV